MNSAELFLLDQAARATLVLLAACLTACAMRRASASARRFVWIATAFCLLALPVLSRLLPPIGARKIQAKPDAGIVMTVSPARISTMPIARHAPSSRTPWIPIVWAAGALIVLGRLAAGIIRLAWLKRTARRIEPTDDVACLESDRISMPMTTGVFRPAILLPAVYQNWSKDRLRLVLAHELIHVRQRDCLFQIVMQFACALYWFHPLAWIAAARLRIERERACDDGVLRLGIHGPEYAGHLLELARTLQPAATPSFAVAMAHQSNLEDRLVALLDAKVNRQKLSRRAAWVTVLASLGLLLPVAAIRGQSQGLRGTISGVVYDASGAVIPHATVLATNLDSHTKEAAITNDAGEYSLASIPVGHYELEVTNRGFKIHRNNLNLNANDKQHVDISMELGNISEKVEVIGKKPAALVGPAAVPQRIRVGGNVVAAQLISKVAPIYPAYSQGKGIEGSVLLEAVIAIDGHVLSLKALNAPDPELVTAAITAVQQWHYTPMLLNGEPVEALTTVIVDFRLTP
jgi:TonB family protein